MRMSTRIGPKPSRRPGCRSNGPKAWLFPLNLQAEGFTLLNPRHVKDTPDEASADVQCGLGIFCLDRPVAIVTRQLSILV